MAVIAVAVAAMSIYMYIWIHVRGLLFGGWMGWVRGGGENWILMCCCSPFSHYYRIILTNKFTYNILVRAKGNIGNRKLSQ